MRARRPRGLVLGALVLAACGAGAVQKPTAADATLASQRWPGTTLAELEEGRTLYVRRCGTCHSLYEPSEYGEPQWRENLAEMRDRAKVRPAEEDRILKYLVAVGSRRAAASL